MTGPFGHSLTFFYDNNGKLFIVLDDLSRGWTYYIDFNLLLSVTSPQAIDGQSATAARIQYTYNTDSKYDNTPASKLLNDIIAPDGGKTTHLYYPNGRGFQTIDATGAVQSFELNLLRKKAYFVDERGNSTRYSYDDLGHTVKLVHPDGSQETSIWNSNNLLTDHTNACGVRQHFDYDGNGNVLTAAVQRLQTNGTYAHVRCRTTA